MKTASEIAKDIETMAFQSVGFSSLELQLMILRHSEECVKLERQRCMDAVMSVWSAVPEDHGPWKRCQNAIQRKIREVEA